MPAGNGYGASEMITMLESWNSTTPPTFAQLLERLYDLRFQGQVVLNFAGGVPRNVVLNQPIQVPLDTRGA